MYDSRQRSLFDISVDSHRTTFSGHESFPLRYTWLYKGVTNCSKNPEVFNQEDAIAVLGVGKNMVRSIRYWCLATRMLEEVASQKNSRAKHLQPSEIGSAIFLGKKAWDPYLEDIGTLWLIHYLLVTNSERATTWFFAFNHVHYAEFSKNSLENALVDFLSSRKLSVPSRNTLKRDIDVLVRTYIPGKTSGKLSIEDAYDCPLIELDLLRPSYEEGTYSFSRGNQENLPNSIFAFALAEFIKNQAQGRKTVTFDEIAYAPYSPGKVFKLNEVSLSERLEEMGELTRGAWAYGETAGLKQLYINDDLDPFALLEAHYLQTAHVG